MPSDNDLDTTPSRLGATVHSPGECYLEIQGSTQDTDVIASGKVFIPSDQDWMKALEGKKKKKSQAALCVCAFMVAGGAA